MVYNGLDTDNWAPSAVSKQQKRSSFFPPPLFCVLVKTRVLQTSELRREVVVWALSPFVLDLITPLPLFNIKPEKRRTSEPLVSALMFYTLFLKEMKHLKTDFEKNTIHVVALLLSHKIFIRIIWALYSNNFKRRRLSKTSLQWIENRKRTCPTDEWRENLLFKEITH